VAESSSAAIVVFASLTGGPLAASQVIASTVTGVGTAERKSGVQWLVVIDMIRAWGLTIPSAGALSWALYILFFHQLNRFL
jgi:PiT family inorganic phosphate transporter